MWPLAADPVDVSGALISAVWTFLGIVVATLGTIAVQALKGRAERRTTQSPPAPVDNASLIQLAKDIGQLDERASDSDDRDEMQDRRLERIERHLDHSNPDWRHD